MLFRSLVAARQRLDAPDLNTGFRVEARIVASDDADVGQASETELYSALIDDLEAMCDEEAGNGRGADDGCRYDHLADPGGTDAKKASFSQRHLRSQIRDGALLVWSETGRELAVG